MDAPEALCGGKNFFVQNGPVHMTEIATMTVSGKNFNFFSRTACLILKLSIYNYGLSLLVK